jgi:Fe-S-cluster containining protein
MKTHKENKENKEICSKCGGACCKGIPGAAFPGDFGYNKNKMKRALKSESWMVGRTMLDNLPFIVPVQKFDGSCIFLKSNGCQLKFKDRPFECKTLNPLAKGGCRHANNKSNRNAAGKAWLKYPKIFNKVT